jgi:hypothetical protein
MLRRTIAAVLWGYFAWYLVALVTTAIGLPPILGPVAGVAMAAVSLHDWRRPRAAAEPASAKELQPSR